MMTYQKLFSEYHQTCGQVLMTKKTMIDNVSRKNAENTFEELFRLGVIPIVNENDTVSTYEIQFGDNDTLSAIVASLIGADLLVLLSDIDGLFTDDPHTNPNAELIETVEKLDEKYLNMAKRYHRKRCRYRRNGNKAECSKNCILFRCGYDHCQCERCRCLA